MDGYQRLANAIVAQAGWDYIAALYTLSYCPDEMKAAKRKREIERFMRSSWFGVLTKADPEYLLQKMRKEDPEVLMRAIRDANKGKGE